VYDVFDVHCRVTPNPVSGTPMVVPIGRHDRDLASETSASEASPSDQGADMNGQVPSDLEVPADRTGSADPT
jgi:hypothetical protein